jgi:hypothetical protein
MPYVTGFLNVHEGGQPDNALPGGGGHPSQGLPGHGHPGQGLPMPPSGTLPAPPPGMWPPPSLGNPILPAPPGTPPGTIWPSPGLPDHPSNVLPGGGHASGQPIPPPPGGSIDNTLPSAPPQAGNGLPSKTYWMICYAPNLGWKYVAVDPSLTPGQGLPPASGSIDNTLPQAPAPKK